MCNKLRSICSDQESTHRNRAQRTPINQFHMVAVCERVQRRTWIEDEEEEEEENRRYVY